GLYFPVGESMPAGIIFTVKIRTVNTSGHVGLIICQGEGGGNFIPVAKIILSPDVQAQLVEITVLPVAILSVGIIPGRIDPGTPKGVPRFKINPLVAQVIALDAQAGFT